MAASASQSQKDHSHKINEILHEAITRGIPGISVVIASSANSWVFSAGVSSIEKHRVISPDNLFGIGSITKVFIAVVILQIIEEGKLTLSTRVRDLLNSDVTRDIDNAAEATVEQLLSHRAGIDSWEDEPSWIRKGRGSETDPSHTWSKTEPLDFIRRPKRFAPEPGNWYYANTNYTLLGLMLEKTTQSTVESEIRRRILEPSSMHHTFLEGFEEQPNSGSITSRYHWATETFRRDAGISPSFPQVHGKGLIDCSVSNLSTEWAAGGLLSSTTDLVRFAESLRNGKLLKPESLAVMKTWRPATDYSDMGHGLFRLKAPNGDHWLGHFGGVLGFSAALWWKDEGDCVVSLLSNVGTMHTGPAPSIADVLKSSEFLDVAWRLAAS